jgi:Ca2+-transporting ATPase
MAYIFAIHIPIACLALVPMLFALPPLLLPLHIALLELIIDPSCSLAFENEPAEHDVMHRPPRDTLAPFFGARAILESLGQGLCVAVAIGLSYWAAQDLPTPQVRAMVLVTLVVSNAMLILANRAQASRFLQSLRVDNRVALGVMAGAVVLLLVGIYTPGLSSALGFAPLPLMPLGKATLLGVASLSAVMALRFAFSWANARAHARP